jgi:Sulfotransferase domain
MPPEKEVSFFNRRYEMGPQWYANTVLRHAPPNAVCGEASVGYMAGTPYADIVKNERLDLNIDDGPYPKPLEDVIPRRIRDLLPNVKLICVLRDPVARAYSHYQMTVLEGTESRAFDDVIDGLLTQDDSERARNAPTATNGYIVNGEYHRILASFLKLFPRGQLMAIFSTELSTDAASTLVRVFDFVGASTDFVPDNLDARYRTAALRRRIPGFDLYDWQASAAKTRSLRAVWHGLPEPLRVKIDRGYRVASYRVTMWNALRGRTTATQGMSASARAKLIAHFLPDSQALGQLIGLEIPWLADWQEA